MTSVGGSFRMAASAASVERAKVTVFPSCVAVVFTFELNIKSSRTAKIMQS